jgi:hypothetical protein
MQEDPTPESLGVARSDYVAMAAKSALGAAPFVGSLLAEIAGSIIPHQRIERVVQFAVHLEKRLVVLEKARVCSQLSDENFTDLVEEGLRQAARSTSDERREYIANVIATSLTTEEVSFIESKHLLRILGELNDIEVIWLASYIRKMPEQEKEFRTKHEGVLAPSHVHMGSSRAELDQDTVQFSYKEHLEQMGLLNARHAIDRKTGVPEFERDGRPKRQGYELSRLGGLLLRHLGFEGP